MTGRDYVCGVPAVWGCRRPVYFARGKFWHGWVWRFEIRAVPK
jgi:hypothetical protein